MVIWSETTSAPSLPHSCFPFIFCSSIWFNLLFTEPCAVNPLVLLQLIDKDCMLLCFGFLIVFFWTWVKELKATSELDTPVWHMNWLPYWKACAWKLRCTSFFFSPSPAETLCFFYSFHFLLIKSMCVFTNCHPASNNFGDWRSRCVRCNNMTD